jgi:hypothetical protein
LTFYDGNFIDSSLKFARISNVRRNRRIYKCYNVMQNFVSNVRPYPGSIIPNDNLYSSVSHPSPIGLPERESRTSGYLLKKVISIL